MATSVEIDDDVWTRLQELAEPLIDTPNSVLRRVLGLDDARTISTAPAPQTRGRAPIGSLLPESEYEIPILRALADAGGSAPSRDVVAAVGKVLGPRLTERDRAPLPNGSERWQSRVQFSRLRLKERGLIKGGSPRGLWELAPAGAAYLNNSDSKGTTA